MATRNAKSLRQNQTPNRLQGGDNEHEDDLGSDG
jgi:hypothetical protein